MNSVFSKTDNKTKEICGDVSLKIAANTNLLPPGRYDGTIVCNGSDVKVTLEVGPKSTSSEPGQKDDIGVNEECGSANPFTAAAGDSIIQTCDVSQAVSEKTQSVFSQPDSKDSADTASFSKTKVDFGDIKGLDRVSETITLNGFAKGRITSSDSRWLQVSPSYVDGTDVPVKITVNSSVLPEGYFEGSISYNNSTVTVGASVEKAEASKLVMGAGLFCLCGSILSLLSFLFSFEDFGSSFLSFLGGCGWYLSFLFILPSWLIYVLNRKKKQSKTLLIFALWVTGASALIVLGLILLTFIIFYKFSSVDAINTDELLPSPVPKVQSTLSPSSAPSPGDQPSVSGEPLPGGAQEANSAPASDGSQAESGEPSPGGAQAESVEPLQDSAQEASGEPASSGGEPAADSKQAADNQPASIDMPAQSGNPASGDNQVPAQKPSENAP
ncbi:MAG: hypothetical protein K6G50_04440 [bacterium]|nr:hypothetical protein [bacterium]